MIQIIPLWPTQSWYPLVLKMIVAPPLVEPRGQTVSTCFSHIDQRSYTHCIQVSLSGCPEIVGELLKSNNIIQGSQRQSTWSRYEAVVAKWQTFCISRDIDPLYLAIADVLNYLSTLFENGQGYSSIATAKSAISSILALDCETTIAALVHRFMKGVFNSHPPSPRYNVIWDVGLVITYLKFL